MCLLQICRVQEGGRGGDVFWQETKMNENMHRAGVWGTEGGSVGVAVDGTSDEASGAAESGCRCNLTDSCYKVRHV